MSEFYTGLAKHLTQILRDRNALPPNYTEISCLYGTSDSAGNKLFMGFIYSNPHTTQNIENHYGYYFGPKLEFDKLLPQIWDELTFDEQTTLMAETLGNKND